MCARTVSPPQADEASCMRRSHDDASSQDSSRVSPRFSRAAHPFPLTNRRHSVHLSDWR